MAVRGGQAQPPVPALSRDPLAPQALPAPHTLALQRGAAGQGGHRPRALHLPGQPRRALRLHRHLPAERARGGAAGTERGPLPVTPAPPGHGHLPACFSSRPLQRRSGVPRSSGKGAPLAALAHGGEQGLRASGAPLPRAGSCFQLGDGSAQPGPWWETLECPCSIPGLGGAGEPEESGRAGRAGRQHDSL